MDIRDEVAQTCILIKSIPFETNIKSISTAVSAEVSVKRVFCYTEQADDSTRFIVQLGTRQDVKKLIAANSLYLRNPADENVKVEVGFCPECIVPTEWVDDDDPSSDLTENDGGEEEQPDGRSCHGSEGETNDNGAVCGGVYSESDREDVNAKFDALTVFSEKKKKNEFDKKGRDIDGLILGEDLEIDSVKQVQKSDDEDRVVYRQPQLEALENPNARVLDMADQSPHPYDTPKPDVYEPIGDVYRPAWNVVNQQRPKSLVEPSVTTRSEDKGPRSISVYVDGHKPLTETDLLGSPDKEKEKQTVFESSICVVARPADKGNNDPDMLKMAKGHVTDTLSSEHEDNVQSKNIMLQSQTNELESTDFAEKAETITGIGCSDKHIGVESDVAGSEDSQKCTLQIPSLPVVQTSDCDHTKDKDIPKSSTGSETPQFYTKNAMTDGSEGQDPGSEKLLSQNSLKHNIEDICSVAGNTNFSKEIPKNEGEPTLLPAGYKREEQEPTKHRSEEITSNTGDQHSLLQHSHTSSAGLLHQVQPLTVQLPEDQQQPSVQPDLQLGQGQMCNDQLGQGQHPGHQACPSEVNVSQPLTGHLGPTLPVTEQIGIGQQQGNNSGLTCQSGQNEQLTGQLHPIPTTSDQALTVQLDPSHYHAGQLGQGQHHTGQSGQGQYHTGQLDQGQHHTVQLDQGQHHTGQLEKGQHHTGQLDQGQHHTGQLDQGQHHTGQLDQGQHHTGQLGQGQHHTGQLDQGQHHTGQLEIGQHHTGQLGQGQHHTGQFGPHTGQLYPGLDFGGQHIADAYRQRLPAPYYPHQRQNCPVIWPSHYQYHYGQYFGPGYSGLPHPMTSDMSPYQSPHYRMPFQPQHPIYPHQIAPNAGAHGQMMYPDFPILYPSVSTPENTPVATMATNMTRPVTEMDVSTGDSMANNRCLTLQNKQETKTSHTGNNSDGSSQLMKGDKARQDIEFMNPKTSFESDKDEIKELEQWAQSPLSHRQIGQATTSGGSTDQREENLYDTIGSIDELEWGRGRGLMNFGEMELVIGNLASVKADVIVNPSNKDLNLAIGYVSKSILNAAGQTIQKECRETYPLGINHDIVAITSAGKLASQKIFHVVLPKWTGEAGSGTKFLEELVTTCLSMAANLKMSSIAFPVLGTGKMGYPADLVAKAMVTSAKKFLNQQHTKFSVYFVIFDTDRANRKAFESLGLESIYSEVEPMEVDEVNHTYTVLTKPHTDSEHLYESLNLNQQETQHKPSLNTDESPYVDMKYINMPRRTTQTSSRAKAASYMNMEEVRKIPDDSDPKITDDNDLKMPDDHDPYAYMQRYKKQDKEVKTRPVGTTGVTEKNKETETVEVPPMTSKPLEDLPRIPEEPPQYLRVTYPQPLLEETIKYYFMNRKKSGGGEFIKFEHHDMKMVTLIQFEDPDAASRVLHKNHTLEGTELQVTMVTGEMPPTIEEKKLLICNINPVTSYDTLVNFLEVRAKAVPTDVMYGNRKDRAVVTFRSKPDFDMLKKICETKILEGNLLKVSRVPVCSVVVVKDCPDVSNDAIMLFFENEKKSGGGDVEKVEVISHRSECLVHFVDPAVAKRVCDPGRKLEIEKKAVTASLYYPYLRSSDGNSSGCKSIETKKSSGKDSVEKRITRPLPDPPLHASMTLPNPVTLFDIESNLTKFVMNSEPNKSAFEKMMLKVNGKVIWPENLQQDLIRIMCTFDVTAKNAAMEVEQWPAEICRNVKKFFGPMTTEEVPVVKQAWTSVISKLQSLNISHPDGVAVILNSTDYTIVIAGHKKFVEDLKKKVEEITKTEESLREEAEQVSKSEVLKMYQIQILWKFKFKEEIKKNYPKLEVEVDVDNKKITFTGVLREVDQGRTDMRVQLESLPSDSLAISRGMKDLFFKMPAKTEFVQQLKQSHLVVVWDIPPHQDTCIIYAKTFENAKQAVSIFTKVLREKKILLKDDLQKVLSSAKWQLALDNLFSKYPEEVQVSVEESCIYVTAISSVFDQVCGFIDDEINEYKKIHDIHKEFLSVEEGVFSFLEKHQRYEIETSTLALQKTLKLIVKTRNSKVKPGYDIEGTRDAIELAKKKLLGVIDKVSMGTHIIQAIGAADFFNSSDGQDKIRQAEHATLSVIRKSEQYGSAQKVRGQSSNLVTKAKCTFGTGQQCIVIEGDMTKLKVDVMVNAANTDMIHGGGIAGAILAAGGPIIQNECDDYVSKYGKIPEGEAIICSSGSLPCKKVVHAVGPVWQNGTQREDRKLRNAVYKSLQLASEYQSIAFPAISAGIFGYPPAKSVETIIEMVQHFFTKYPSSMIRSVYLCDTDDQIVKLFIKELVSTYSPQRVKIFDDTDSTSSAEEESFDEVTSDEESEEEIDDVQRNIALRVVRGELAKTKADILVNSAPRDLMLNVGLLSNSLLKCGGQSLQTECTQRYPRGISPGEVAITTGGNLQCNKVYHGTFDSWGNDQRRCVQILKKFVSSCLYTADKFRMNSIAFPALGAGRLGYPAATVAKVMLSCVRGFDEAMPNSSLTTVMFVVYPQDKQTVQDFESVVDDDRFRSGGATGSSRTVSSSYSASSSLGPVDIEVKQGDITKETTDAIINSTGDHLDLTRGAVSRAILKAGGQQLQVECNARSRDMQSRGLVTTSGGNLSCRIILHVRSCSRPTDLARTVTTCLEEADNLKCNSLTFPALGTGQVGCPPKDVADAMFTAIQQYTGQLQYLRKVRIVIFQADMVDIFKAQLKRHLGGESNARTTRRPSQTKQKATYKSKGTKPKYKGHRSQTSSYATPDRVKFLLWSNSSASLQKAKNHLDRVCNLEFRKLQVPPSYQDIIKRLNKYQIDELSRLGSQRQVHLEINQAKGEITLQGRHSQTSVLLPEIQSILHKFEKHKDEVEKAKTVADYVQWVYDDNGKWRRYNAEVNLVIEKAYKAKDVQTKIKDSSGVTYIIDFQKMEEYVKDSPHKKYKVERRDLGERSLVGIRLPSSWSSMGKDGYQLVNLSPSDTEYKDTEKSFCSSAGRASAQQAGLHQFLMQGFMAPQYGHHKIIKIQRIQNKSLYQQYSAKKQELLTQNMKDPEKWLWHGTSPDTVEKIAMKGFDRSYCGKNATAYGNGVYFAVDASYSIGYCQADSNGQKHMFYSRVLTGESCRGYNGMKYLPDRQGARGTSGVLAYDSATNNLSAPSMYIIFHDSQAYPAYLISFK